MENQNKTVLSAFVYYELNNGNKIPCIKRNDLKAIFNLQYNELDYVVNRVRIYCKENSMKTLYNNHFFFGMNNSLEAISVVGISFICKEFNHLNPYLKDLEDSFKNFALEWFYKVDFYKKHSTTIRNVRAGLESNVDWETASEFKITKSIESKLKRPKEDVEDTSHFFYKKAVVITGTFDNFPIRNDMAKLLYNCGADVNSSISKKTNYVIVGKEAGPKKLEKIAELNIEIIDEIRFIEIFKKNG